MTIDIADAPAWLVELFDVPATEARQAPPDIELDLPYSIGEAQRWLDRQPLAAEGNASDTFYRYACRLKDFALSAETAVALLHARHPEYGEEDIGQRVENAFNYGQNEPGSDRPLSHEEVFAAVEPPPPPPPLVDSGFRTMSWLRAQTFPAIRWQWDKRIPSFKPIIITGPPKTGKTTFLLNLAVHMAAGVDFLGAGVRPSDVAMLLAEDEYGQVRDNLEAIRQTHGFDGAVLDRLHIRSVIHEPVTGGHWLCRIADTGEVTDTQFMREIVAPLLATLNEPVFMIDPLVEFVGLNRYSEQGPRGLVHWLNSVARIGKGVTPLITDHPTIASVQQGRDIGGNVQMEGSFPTVAALKAGRWEKGLTMQRPMTFELKFSRYAPEHSVEFYRREGSPAFNTEAAIGTRPSDHRSAVFRLIMAGQRSEPRWHFNRTNSGSGPKVIAGRLGIRELLARDALEQLEELGWLQYIPRASTGAHGHIPAHYEAGPEAGSEEAREALQPPAPIDGEPEVW